MNYYYLEPKKVLLEQKGEHFKKYKELLLVINLRYRKTEMRFYEDENNLEPTNDFARVDYYNLLENKNYTFHILDFEELYEPKRISALYCYILAMVFIYKKVFLHRF